MCNKLYFCNISCTSLWKPKGSPRSLWWEWKAATSCPGGLDSSFRKYLILSKSLLASSGVIPARSRATGRGTEFWRPPNRLRRAFAWNFSRSSSCVVLRVTICAQISKNGRTRDVYNFRAVVGASPSPRYLKSLQAPNVFRRFSIYVSQKKNTVSGLGSCYFGGLGNLKILHLNMATLWHVG